MQKPSVICYMLRIQEPFLVELAPKELGEYKARSLPTRSPRCAFSVASTQLKHVCHFSQTIINVAQCFSARGREGITPEQFWANSERLVDLAKGCDRIAFDEVIVTLTLRHSKLYPGSVTGGSAERPPQGGYRNGGAPTESNLSNAEDSEHDRMKRPWQPGGPELHADLGATGEEAGWQVAERCTERTGFS